MSEEKDKETTGGQLPNDNSDPDKKSDKDETSNENISSNEPIAETEQFKTQDPELITKNMEVHHHAHESRGKKNWKNYFWEFLMLFLAVFCGFLAEYQLEHKVERDRELQYMESMLEDLHRDTAGIQAVYELGQQQKFMGDTLLELINNHPLTDDNIMKLYSINTNSTRIVITDFENRTALQLKNAGGMRLIRKKNVVDSILGYWRFIETCQTVSARLERLGETRFNVSTRIFHNKYYIPGNARLQVASGIREGAALVSNDPVLMAEYSNLTFAKKLILNNYLLRIQEAKIIAVRLMDVIRKGYHLEE